MTALALLAASFALSSPAFANGHAIPARYACGGADVSPPLRWTAPPTGTRSFSLRLVDLSTSPPFRHWTLTAIPARLRSLAAGTHVGRPAANDFGDVGYGGPCPPLHAGRTHRYRFELDALGAGGRVLARARLVGTYRR